MFNVVGDIMRRILKYLLAVLSVVFFTIGLISCGESNEQNFYLLSKEYSLAVGAKTQIAYARYLYFPFGPREICRIVSPLAAFSH